MPHGLSKHNQRKALKPKLKPSLPITRPIKDTKRTRATISTAGILKRKPMKEVHGKTHSRRHGTREPQHELFLDYQDRVENSRAELINSSYAALHQTHSELTTWLAKLKLQDTSFHENAEARRGALLAPLTEEMVETNFTRDGKFVKETLQIGQRIEAFKALLIKKEAELALYWVEWEKVQAKIVQLGIEVLGVEAFGGSTGYPSETKGYRKDMEELDLDHEAWLEEIEEEIQLVGEEYVKKMQATEKELDASLRKEQASFIAQVFATNDY